MNTAHDVWWTHPVIGYLIVLGPAAVIFIFLYLSYRAHSRGKPPGYCLAIAAVPIAVLGLFAGYYMAPRSIQVAWNMVSDGLPFLNLSTAERFLMALVVLLFTGVLFFIPMLLVPYLFIRSYRASQKWNWVHRAVLVVIILSYPLTLLFVIALGSV